jgi:hypothetical protein
MKKRIAIAAVLSVAGIGLLLGGLWLAFQWRFYPEVEQPAFPAPQNSAVAMRQDLEFLALLPKYDRSFTPGAAAKFEAERQALLAKASTLTPAQLEMEVSRLVAFSNNGHTTVGRRLRRLHRVPVRVQWFEEGLFVVRAAQPHAEHVGRKVLRINGKTPKELLAAFAPYVSGTAEHAKATIPIFLVSPTAFAGVWPAMAADKLEFTFEAVAGKPETIVLASTAPDPEIAYPFPDRDFAPQQEPGEKEPWAAVLADRKELPLVLRDPDHSLYHVALPGDGLYIHLNAISDDDRGDLGEQLAKLMSTIAPGTLKFAVLDLRFNGGGNYTRTLDFTKELPKKVASDGKVFILTDNGTFSAALVTAARAKYFAGNRAVILGEKLGDRGQFWAEAGSPIVLPNSKIRVFFATGYHDWERGCGWNDVSRCFWLNVPYDVPAGDLAPRHPVAWKFADYRAGRDTLFASIPN